MQIQEFIEKFSIINHFNSKNFWYKSYLNKSKFLNNHYRLFTIYNFIKL